MMMAVETGLMMAMVVSSNILAISIQGRKIKLTVEKEVQFASPLYCIKIHNYNDYYSFHYF
jgi:hypothetical protein